MRINSVDDVYYSEDRALKIWDSIANNSLAVMKISTLGEQDELLSFLSSLGYRWPSRKELLEPPRRVFYGENAYYFWDHKLGEVYHVKDSQLMSKNLHRLKFSSKLIEQWMELKRQGAIPYVNQ